MKFIVASIIVISAFLGSCAKEDPLVLSSLSFTEESFDICKTVRCPEITVNYLEASGAGEVSKRINSELIAFIITSLSIGDDSIPKSQNINEAAAEFIKIYQRDIAEFPDMAAEYIAEINITDIYRTEDLISFQLQQYLYTGGAHGNENISFMNIDPFTGTNLLKRISLSI